MFVERGGMELAVFHLESGEFVVTDNACPHAGANLVGGELQGTVVTCPWHQWEFDLSTGACVHSDSARIVRYPVRVSGDDVFSNLGDPE